MMDNTNYNLTESDIDPESEWITNKAHISKVSEVNNEDEDSSDNQQSPPQLEEGTVNVLTSL